MEKVSVLVVDDEPDNLFAISRILKTVDYKVLEAPNGKKALELAKKEHPDLILLDVVLPDINGIDLSYKIKKDKELRDILIILISGIEISSNIQAKGLEKGADGYLVRPIPKRELLARIDSILRIKNAEKEMYKSEKKYRLIVENAKEGIWSIDAEANTMYANPCMANMLGYTVEEMLGRHLYSFMTSDAIELAKENLKRREQGIEENHDFQFIRKDGAKIYTNIETSPIMDDDGNYKGAIALVSDITKRRQMEVKLKNSVKEKEMLLKEIHHRVKNNLMVISSLLNLQSQYIKDKEALNIFKESQSRARSMALIHELLYKSTDLKRINFGDYIRTLSSELLRTYSTGNILLNLFVEDLMLDINTTVPLGLIVNELVSNSLKHAFPQGQEGNIVINFHKSKEKYILIVKDDGVGFPEEVDYKNSDTLGLQIVNSLTGQIDGVISLEKGKGTKFTLKLREEAYY